MGIKHFKFWAWIIGDIAKEYTGTKLSLDYVMYRFRILERGCQNYKWYLLRNVLWETQLIPTTNFTLQRLHLKVRLNWIRSTICFLSLIIYVVYIYIYKLCCYNSKMFVYIHKITHTYSIVKHNRIVYGMYSLYLASSAMVNLFWEWPVKGYFLQETQLPTWSSLVERREVTCRS